MNQHTPIEVLRALYEMAAGDERADLGGLAGRLGLSCARTLELLDRLDRAGLADADRVRLTMTGLAIAASAPPLARSARAA